MRIDVPATALRVVAVPPRMITNQTWFWLVMAAILIVLLFIFRTVVLPFLGGLFLAYILDPLWPRGFRGSALAASVPRSPYWSSSFCSWRQH